MKNRFAGILPSNIPALQHLANEKEKQAKEAFQRVSDNADADPDIVFALLDEWENAHVNAFRLSIVSQERLAYEKLQAEKNIAPCRKAFKNALRDGDDQESLLSKFKEWEKSLVYAKEFGVDIDTSDFVSQSALLLDVILKEVQTGSESFGMNEWNTLYAHIMRTFARLKITNTQFDLAMLYATARLGSNI